MNDDLPETAEAFHTALDPLKMADDMEWLHTPKPRGRQLNSPDLVAWYIRLELWMQTSHSKSAARMRKVCRAQMRRLKEERKERFRKWADEED